MEALFVCVCVERESFCVFRSPVSPVRGRDLPKVAVQGRRGWGGGVGSEAVRPEEGKVSSYWNDFVLKGTSRVCGLECGSGSHLSLGH